MKSILETSIYLFIMAFICFISLSFIKMNQDVTHVNEISTYIEGYIESMGVCETAGDGSINYYKYSKDAGGNYILDASGNKIIVPATPADVANKSIKTFAKLKSDSNLAIATSMKNYAAACGLHIDIKYEYLEATNNYVYMNYTITYDLSHGMLGFKKTLDYTGLARFSLIG